MTLALLGTDSLIGVFLAFAIVSLIAIWVALIVFTYSDARKRISDPFLVGCATAASFFPFVGTLVYTIVRPPELLEDAEERDWDLKATQASLRKIRATSCRKCGYPAEVDFIRCPSCRSRLREPCPSCDRPVGIGWKLCPYCEHTLIEPKSATRRRADSDDSPARKSRRTTSSGSRPSGRKEPDRSGSGKSTGSRAGRKSEPDSRSADPKSGSGNRRTRSSRSSGGDGASAGSGEKPINSGGDGEQATAEES